MQTVLTVNRQPWVGIAEPIHLANYRTVPIIDGFLPVPPGSSWFLPVPPGCNVRRFLFTCNTFLSDCKQAGAAEAAGGAGVDLFLLPAHIDVDVDVQVDVDFVVCLARRIHLCRSRVVSWRVEDEG